MNIKSGWQILSSASFSIFLVSSSRLFSQTDFLVENSIHMAWKCSPGPDPMLKVFRKLTKCDFHKFGPSGTIQNIDALCILSMNILNEKIFIFIWFWFLILGGVTTLNLLVRLFQLMVPSIRRKLILRTRMLRCNETERFLSELGISDWMILYHLSHSMHKGYFSEIIDKMVEDDVCEVFSDENDINDDPLPFP